MATLILEDGARFEGRVFGHQAPVCGEVVFTTGMIGYQEIITDPSYAGQIVCMTYPLIGNVGINDLDFASDRVHLKGLLVSELCDLPSNWQLKGTLSDYLDAQGVCGLHGVDTRALTRHIRSAGVMRGYIVEDDAQLAALKNCSAETGVCSCKESYEAGEGDVTVGILDMGVTRAVVNAIASRGVKVRVYPAATPAAEILAQCAGVFISGGPGNPADYPQITQTVREIMDKVPTFGTCMGHLLMARAMGGETVRMKYGHHGGNQPVKDLARGTCVVTSQSHLYMLDENRLPANAKVSHINWNDQTIAGLQYTDRAAFSVQFVPDGGKCPSGTAYLYDNFLAAVRAGQ